MNKKKCPCGKWITKIIPALLKRKKYCSNRCKYKYQVRPTGLKYKIKKINPAWFKDGHTPWHAGTRGQGIKKASPASWKKGHVPYSKLHPEVLLRGDKNHFWRGDNVGYGGVHKWLYKEFGIANKCEGKECSFKNPKRFEWSNISGKYLRDRSDWEMLCPSCHRKYDKKMKKERSNENSIKK